MDDAQIEDFRTALLQQKAELLDLQAGSKEDVKPVQLDQAATGRLTRMDTIQAQQMAQASSRRREQQLLKIEGALRRIAAGEYGRCFRCGEQIDPRRLAADPTITRCVQCAGRDDSAS